MTAVLSSLNINRGLFYPDSNKEFIMDYSRQQSLESKHNADHHLIQPIPVRPQNFFACMEDFEMDANKLMDLETLELLYSMVNGSNNNYDNNDYEIDSSLAEISGSDASDYYDYTSIAVQQSNLSSKYISQSLPVTRTSFLDERNFNSYCKSYYLDTRINLDQHEDKQMCEDTSTFDSNVITTSGSPDEEFIFDMEL